MGELGWVFRIEHRHLSSAQCHGPADCRSFFSSSKAPVINLTVATEATDQCDTRIDRAPA
jgi:hypothetical protein